jgi:hypothetical protein
MISPMLDHRTSEPTSTASRISHHEPRQTAVVRRGNVRPGTGSWSPTSPRCARPSTVPVPSHACSCNGASHCNCEDAVPDSAVSQGSGPAPRHSCGLLDESGVDQGAPKPPGGPERDVTEPGHELGQPHQGDATIVCDGKGGYRVDLRGWANAPCGLVACIRRHEETHITDWKGRWPDGCKDKADGAQIPLGGAGYDAFLKASECRAYTAELACNAPLLDAAKGDCVQTIRDHRQADLAEQKRYCG